MARKNLLKGLMEAPEKKSADGSEPPSPALPPRQTKGAIGAVSKSIADLKTRAIADLDAALIDDGGLTDRLPEEVEDHERLKASIAEYGQQVPVLVRPAPDDPARYQIVYGRRRLAALRELGLPVKAMIRELDDDALIMAQGQENSARKDLSFIEKSLFAQQMQEAGYKRKIICDALTIDKTVISRMLQVVERIPVGVIQLIGAAHGAGRDRWLKLSEAFGTNGLNTRQSTVAVNKSGAKTSDERFEVVFKLAADHLRSRKAAKPKPQPASRTPLKAGAATLGAAQWKAGKLTLTVDQAAADGFDEWLVENFSQIHARWKAGRE